MGKTPVPGNEALRPLNVKVPPEDLYFLHEVLKPALGVSYNAEAVREVLVQLRTCFRLPHYVVEALLEAEMKARKLSILGYVQELLLRRYEALAAQGQTRGVEISPHPGVPASSSKTKRR